MDIASVIWIAIGAFGWGMFVQKALADRKRKRDLIDRVYIDAPFSRDQAEYLMNSLREIKRGIDERMGTA